MGIFNKKESVPSVPPAPGVPSSVPNQQEMIPAAPGMPAQEPITPVQGSELPSLPGGVGQNVNQEMVKSAVTDNSQEEIIPSPPTPGMEELPKDFKLENNLSSPAPIIDTDSSPSLMDQNPDMQGSIAENDASPSMADGEPAVVPETPSETPKSAPKKEEDAMDKIFVRIDKFQEVKKSLDEINQQVVRVESLAEKIEKVKTEEVSEIDQLGKDLEDLKKKLAEVDSNIFQKI